MSRHLTVQIGKLERQKRTVPIRLRKLLQNQIRSLQRLPLRVSVQIFRSDYDRINVCGGSLGRSGRKRKSIRMDLRVNQQRKHQ